MEPRAAPREPLLGRRSVARWKRPAWLLQRLASVIASVASPEYGCRDLAAPMVWMIRPMRWPAPAPARPHWRIALPDLSPMRAAPPPRQPAIDQGAAAGAAAVSGYDPSPRASGWCREMAHRQPVARRVPHP